MADEWGFETKAIHTGQEPDEATGAVTVPIYQTSTYAQDGVGKDRGFEYSRTGNPTRDALETSLSALEGATYGRAFASGMAAEDTILRSLRPGDHLVMGNDAYGGTYRLITRVIAEMGVEWSTVDYNDASQLAEAMRPRTRLVWTETPTNPMLGVVDIAQLAETAHANDALLVVDNTFATPYLQRPLEHGADLVVHSTTKYAGGHSDVVGGFVATNDAAVDEQLGFLQNSVGAIPGPMDCYLLLRGLKTLAVRMDRHCDNAEAIVEFLSRHSGVTDVIYPGLDTNPGHAAAVKQMKRFGGMVSFIVAAGAEAANELVARTDVFTLAESLGAVESLIEVPAGMTHLSVAGSSLAVDPALVRLSVGLENIDDLIADLSQAFEVIT
jgi:cystathionine gamma-synthase